MVKAHEAAQAAKRQRGTVYREVSETRNPGRKPGSQGRVPRHEAKVYRQARQTTKEGSS